MQRSQLATAGSFCFDALRLTIQPHSGLGYCRVHIFPGTYPGLFVFNPVRGFMRSRNAQLY